ncbi:DUF3800 domain-containing protein [Gemmatimonas sp.]|uniref:DUF3800 domain-containing protein n=1 Tax=Gemmatimonas sp. TaxID=1962908 RepID=UPI00356292A0
MELLLRKLDEFAASEGAQLLLVMDEHQDRDAWVDQAARMMYQNADKLRHFIEPPYQVESHRYQTVQCADWICGLIGRFGAYRADPDAYSDWQWAEQVFAPRIDDLALCKQLTLILPTAELSATAKPPCAPELGPEPSGED